MTRLELLREKMSLSGIDAVIIYDELNQRYLSRFSFTDGFLFITAREAYLITDFRYYEMAIKNSDREFKVLMPEKKDEFLKEAISEGECTTVGFEGNFVSFAAYKSLCERFCGVKFENIGTMIEDIRRIKAPDEIEKMQKAQNITDKAYEHILSVLNPEKMTEIDVAVELEYAMRKNGAEGFAFDTIAVSGDASALPHGTPRDVKLKKGFLTMDFGARLDGYCSDMTRTVVIGKADREIKNVYNTVLSAQKAALDFLCAGVDAGEADKVARDIIDSKYKGAFGHSLGHSVGLFIHEAPGLSMRSFGYKLRVGEILTVEPGIYIFGKYGCRIEDMIKIEECGVYNFTHSPKDLIEIL